MANVSLQDVFMREAELADAQLKYPRFPGDIIELGQPNLPDLVNHPPHYTKNGIECISAIRASMTDDGYKAYLKGNILKYLWRYEHKNGLQDLQKAEWYLKELIIMNEA